MTRIKFVWLLSIVLVTFGVYEMRALTSTASVVGNCKPGLPTYTTISAAVAAVPSGSTVLVCPGTYIDQVHITQALTLTGLSAGDSDRAIIAPPTGGLAANAIDNFGFAVAAQVWVDNASGTVNINNITVDGTGNGVPQCVYPYTYIGGIFYQNSPGAVNRVTARNQSGNGCGIGIWFEGGSANPAVTVRNSSVRNFDLQGILTETNSGTSELTATIQSNVVVAAGTTQTCIEVAQGTTDTVTGNVTINGEFGMGVGGVSGSISGNTITGATFGLDTLSDGISVTNNKVFNSSTGITVNTAVAQIQSNVITNATTAIEFFCHANNNVNRNVITDAVTGLDQIPAGVSSLNTYDGVDTVSTGGCP